MSKITESDLKAIHQVMKFGNYTDARIYVIDMDYVMCQAEGAGHTVGQVVTIEPDRALVVLRETGEEQWFPISSSELNALSAEGFVCEGGLDEENDQSPLEPERRGSYVLIKDNKIALVF